MVDLGAPIALSVQFCAHLGKPTASAQQISLNRLHFERFSKKRRYPIEKRFENPTYFHIQTGRIIFY